jgi:3-hydroxybutyryl-CoA dehydrogenase
MDVKRIAVIGAGQMGRGIAHVAAVGGFEVNLFDIKDELLESALITIKKNMQKGVERGKLTAENMDASLKRIKKCNELTKSVEGVQLVIEAVPEDLAIKHEVFKILDDASPEDVIFATNTSSMSITEIGSITKRQDRFIGMHFFIPAHIMKLVEIIRGLETSDKTTEIVDLVAKQMGKETVLINEFPGFATSRINALIGNEAFYMLMEGVGSARDIDKALKLGLNHPMGPFEMIDMVGLDTRLKTLEYLYKTLGEKYRPCPLHVKYVKAGRLGRKVGKGVYDYTDDEKN